MDRSSPTIFISAYTDSPFLRSSSVNLYLSAVSLSLLFSLSLFMHIPLPNRPGNPFSGYPAIKPQMPKPIIRRTIAFGTGLNDVVGIWPMLFVGKSFELTQRGANIRDSSFASYEATIKINHGEIVVRSYICLIHRTCNIFVHVNVTNLLVTSSDHQI